MDGTMVIVGPNYPQLEMGDQDPECVIGEPVRIKSGNIREYSVVQ